MAIDLAALSESYRQDGYVAVEGVLTRHEVAALRDEAAAICRGDRADVIGADARADETADAVLSRILAIHFPHKASDLIRRTMAHPKIVPILCSLVGENVKSMQTMLFLKRHGKPGQAWHQDEHYIPTRDRSLCGAWIALDDATVENGCLWMHPGSHRPGVLYPMASNQDPRFDGTGEAQGFPFAREGGVPVPLRSGGVAFFNGYVLHRLLRNDAPTGFRRALVTHYCSAETLIPWALGQDRRDAQDYRDIEMIAGSDPYAWKGREDLVRPFVRHEDPARQREILNSLSRIGTERG